MTAEDLRGLIRRRIEACAKYEALAASLTPEQRIVSLYCQHPHRGSGRGPKLAEAAIVDGHLMFVSRIDWLPSDELNLRPWTREYLEGQGLVDPAMNGLLADDEKLLAWSRANEEWSQGRESGGDRWIARTGPTVICVAVRLGEQTPLGLWVRCARHPESAEALDPVELVAATR